MKKAVIYTRVSTEEQAKHDLSLPFQKDKCNEYAEKNGYVVMQEFEDAGKSARTANRPALLEMISYISNRKINAVIVHKSDRLSRDMADFWTMRKMFKDKEIKLLSVTENFDDNSPSSEFMMGIMSAQAQFYSANLGHEVKKGVSQKVKQGWWPNNAPLGYENFGRKHERLIRPVPETAKYIKQAFKLFSTGEFSITSLTNKLQALGMTSQKGNPISRSAVSRMLRNPIYYGEFIWNGKLHKGKHKPIIKKSLFDSVQVILNTRKVKGSRDRTHNFLLRGFVYCSCGSRLVGEIKNKKNKQYYYFGCKSRKKEKKCSKEYIRMEELENKVTELFKQIVFTNEFKDYVIKTAKDIIREIRETETAEEKLIKQRMAKIKNRMKNAEDDRLDRVINPEQFGEIYGRLTKELADTMKEFERIQSDHTDSVKMLNEILTLSENIYSTYQKAKPTYKRKYLKMFFEKIVVDRREIIDIKFNSVIEDLIKIREVRISDQWR
ncbi:hypothetical protein GF362_01210, partial [Candidatus Dojkabacteria bacterium]|nr:hypothetical protein [Candidatus Dojkabacteria bacterium]